MAGNRFYGADVQLTLVDDKGTSLQDVLLTVESFEWTDNGTVDEHWPYHSKFPEYDPLPGGYTVTISGKQIDTGMAVLVKARDTAWRGGTSAPVLKCTVNGSKNGKTFLFDFNDGAIAPGARWTMGQGNVAITNSVTLRFSSMT